MTQLLFGRMKCAKGVCVSYALVVSNVDYNAENRGISDDSNLNIRLLDC